MTAPKTDHWIVAKCVLCYVSGTLDYGLLYIQKSNSTLCGYIDSDWVNYIDDCKSTTRYVFSLGSTTMTWTSKKQWVVTLSSTEAKYRVVVKASCEEVWLLVDACKYACSSTRTNSYIL